MSAESLRYFANDVCRNLKKSVEANLARYLSEGFVDLASESDWRIELKATFDLSALKMLSSTVDDDAQSSRIVWNCLGGLTPSLAMEGRIWTRLCHVECIDYARKRWIDGRTGPKAVKVIEDHFFAETRTACRDDNAIGRLWWTAYVAKLAMPDDVNAAIAAVWKTADIRSNVVERPWITSRPQLAGGIVRALVTQPAVSSSETAFRDFMKAINAQGGGVLFEALNETEVDAFIKKCIAGK
jgi:hypothetical protein